MRRLAGRIVGGALVLTLGGVMLAGVSGCKKEEPPPPPPKRTPPPPPPPPEPVDLAQIRASLGDVDARVQFPQEQAPLDESLAEAVFRFASALARKDASALRPMMSLSGRRILDEVEAIWWDTEIEAVRVVSLTPGGGGAPREREGVAGGPFTPEMIEQMLSDAMSELGQNLPPEAQEAMKSALLGGQAEMVAQMFNQMPREQLLAMLEQQEQQLDDPANAPQLEMMAQMMQMSVDELRDAIRRVSQAQRRQIEEILASGESEDEEVSDTSATLVFAVQDQSGAFVLIFEAQHFSDGWFFTPKPATTQTRQSVRDFDGLSMSDYLPEIREAPELPEIPDVPAGGADGGGSDRRGGGSTTSGG